MLTFFGLAPGEPLAPLHRHIQFCNPGGYPGTIAGCTVSPPHTRVRCCLCIGLRLRVRQDGPQPWRAIRCCWSLHYCFCERSFPTERPACVEQKASVQKTQMIQEKSVTVRYVREVFARVVKWYSCCVLVCRKMHPMYSILNMIFTTSSKRKQRVISGIQPGNFGKGVAVDGRREGMDKEKKASTSKENQTYAKSREMHMKYHLQNFLKKSKADILC